MQQETFRKYEQFMLSHMKDSAHDPLHVYRVLYAALDIAQHEKDADTDVLVTACLLHDIGRDRQFEDPSLCHAREGGEMAYEYLLGEGVSVEKAAHVRDCISSHRYRGDNPPQTIEAKILFDSDKLDVCGLIGMARTMLYQGHEGIPLYTMQGDAVSDGADTDEPSFLHEYNFKLKKVPDGLHTDRAKELAVARRDAAAAFYKGILSEIRQTHENGVRLLRDVLFP